MQTEIQSRIYLIATENNTSKVYDITEKQTYILILRISPKFEISQRNDLICIYFDTKKYQFSIMEKEISSNANTSIFTQKYPERNKKPRQKVRTLIFEICIPIYILHNKNHYILYKNIFTKQYIPMTTISKNAQTIVIDFFLFGNNLDKIQNKMDNKIYLMAVLLKNDEMAKWKISEPYHFLQNSVFENSTQV